MKLFYLKNQAFSTVMLVGKLSELYECVGDVPNVTFPCATLADADTGRIAIYYGCADTVTGLAFTTVDTLLDHIKNNSL